MPLVIVERRFTDPAVLDELQAKEDAVAWCLEENDVRFLRTYFSSDQRNMLCVYEAPDAESVRRTQRQAGLPFERVWTAAGMFRALLGREPAPETLDQQLYVCERTYPQPIPLEVVRIASDNGQTCFAENGVQLIDSYIAADDSGSLCLFTAPDAERIRHANRRIHLPFDRVWPATVHEAP